MSMSKVSLLDLIRSTDVCRYEFYSSVMTAGCMDPMEAFGNVFGWLRGICMSKVSLFDF